MTDRTDRRTGLAVVMGSGGGIGAALLAQLQREAGYAQALGFSRNTEVRVDYLDEASLVAAAQWVAAQCAATGLDLRLLIVATGFLHGEQGQPERSFNHLDAAYLQHVFAINTIGPALVMKHFLPLLPKSRPLRGGLRVGQSRQHRRQRARWLVWLPRLEGSLEPARQNRVD